MPSYIYPNDLRSGMIIEMDGELYEVMEAQHFKIAKTSAYVRAKLKNFLTGRVIDVKLNPDERIVSPYVERKKAQYLYSSGDEYVFMDLETYEQIPLRAEQLGDKAKYLKEGLEVDMVYVDEKPITIELPLVLEYKVEYTEPGVKGDRVATAMKPAKLENGMEIMVPLFIEIGDVIQVDTRTGEYVGRA